MQSKIKLWSFASSNGWLIHSFIRIAKFKYQHSLYSVLTLNDIHTITQYLQVTSGQLNSGDGQNQSEKFLRVLESISIFYRYTQIQTRNFLVFRNSGIFYPDTKKSSNVSHFHIKEIDFSENDLKVSS